AVIDASSHVVRIDARTVLEFELRVRGVDDLDLARACITDCLVGHRRASLLPGRIAGRRRPQSHVPTWAVVRKRGRRGAGPRFHSTGRDGAAPRSWRWMRYASGRRAPGGSR